MADRVPVEATTKETPMKQYLLSIYQPDGPPPASVDMEQVGHGLAAFDRELREAGAWVFNGPLHPASTATVVQVDGRGGDALMTDGPYLEGKEHIGGLTIVRAPDLDAALVWARKLAAVLPLPVEVRPFVGDGEA